MSDQPTEKRVTPVLPVKLPARRLVECVESEPVDSWAQGCPGAAVVPAFALMAEA